MPASPPFNFDDWIARLAAATASAEAEFAGLSPAQLNWQPHPKTWSIGTLLEHIIQSNHTYFDTFEKIGAGTKKNTWWENRDFISRIFGKHILKIVSPDYKGKSTSPPAFKPASSEVPADILQKFRRHNEQLASLIQQTAGADPQKMKVTSPAAKFIHYTLEDTIKILVLHAERHIGQARERMRHPQFPVS